MISQGAQPQAGDSSRDSGGFLEALAPAVREALSKGATCVGYEKGAKIVDAVSPARPGVVLQGLIRAYVFAHDGREATVAYLRPGDAIEIAGTLLDACPSSLQALEPTVVLSFDPRQFEAVLANEVDLALRVSEALAREVGSYARVARVLAFGRVEQRVAEHLISLADRDRHGRLVARVTQQGLADAVGSVRDVVARSLAHLSQSGVVVTSHGKVEVINEDALRQAAEIR